MGDASEAGPPRGSQPDHTAELVRQQEGAAPNEGAAQPGGGGGHSPAERKEGGQLAPPIGRGCAGAPPAPQQVRRLPECSPAAEEPGDAEKEKQREDQESRPTPHPRTTPTSVCVFQGFLLSVFWAKGPETPGRWGAGSSVGGKAALGLCGELPDSCWALTQTGRGGAGTRSLSLCRALTHTRFKCHLKSATLPTATSSQEPKRPSAGGWIGKGGLPSRWGVTQP